MCLFRRPRFLTWFCLNVFFGLDILLNNDWVTNIGHQLDSVNVDLVSPSSSSSTQSSFALGTANDDQVRLLCWIPLSAPFGSSLGERAIRETWGKRCDRLVFVFTTGVKNGSAGQVIETDDGGVIQLVGSTMSDVFQYLYDHHLDDSDWFLKAEQDTYVVTEQLKVMLSIQDTTTPCYWASNDREDPAMISGAYVLSRESIRRLVHHFRHQSDVNYSSEDAVCKEWSHYANFGKGIVSLPKPATRKCLHHLGLVARNTRDERGCERFLTNRLTKELAENDVNSGDRCISPIAIIFSQIHHNQFHVYEHLLYRLSLMPNVVRKG